MTMGWENGTIALHTGTSSSSGGVSDLSRLDGGSGASSGLFLRSHFGAESSLGRFVSRHG